MSLQADLKDLFEGMQDGSKTNDDFCDGVGSAVASYVSTLQFAAPVVAGQDSINQGVFAGSASGTFSIADSDVSDALKACCNEMWDNRSDENYDGAPKLAQAFADALDAASGNIEWSVKINGQTTVPGTPPVIISPVQDDGEITATFVSVTIPTALENCFNTMKSMTDGGDAYFAAQLATLIQTYFTTAVCVVQGTSSGGLANCVGNGVIS